jgi:hypothetical protein
VTKVDSSGSSVTISEKGVVRIDEIPVFAIRWYDGVPWVQVRDRNRQRCRVRGAQCVEVSWDSVMAKVVKETEKRENRK